MYWREGDKKGKKIEKRRRGKGRSIERKTIFWPGKIPRGQKLEKKKSKKKKIK